MTYSKQARGFFITGTDTGVGKTRCTELLLKNLKNKNLAAIGCKPLACGSQEDAIVYLQANTLPLPIEEVNPVYLSLPASPNIGARLEQQSLHADELVVGLKKLLSLPVDCVLFEGVGGWKVPINETETTVDIAIGLNLPVILVVGIRVGCLNHALLTAEAIKSSGLPMAGWIANIIAPDTPQIEAHIGTLQALMPGPCLGRIAFGTLDKPLEGEINVDQLLGHQQDFTNCSYSMQEEQSLYSASHSSCDVFAGSRLNKLDPANKSQEDGEAHNNDEDAYNNDGDAQNINEDPQNIDEGADTIECARNIVDANEKTLQKVVRAQPK